MSTDDSFYLDAIGNTLYTLEIFHHVPQESEIPIGAFAVYEPDTDAWFIMSSIPRPGDPIFEFLNGN